jgi:hypothetical protein
MVKDALAHLGPYQTLTKVWYNDPGAEILFHCPPPYKFKKSPYKQILYDDSP